MKKFRRIGILTSGGDAPGMNAVVRAAARAGSCPRRRGLRYLRGYKGLIHDNMKLFSSPADLCNIITRSGTILYSDRCLEFKTPEGMAKAIATCEKNHIDGIIACGGDGTFRGATGPFQSWDTDHRHSRHHRQRHHLHRLHRRLRYCDEHGRADGGQAP